ELGTAILTFGLPTVILSYPKSTESKKYFTVISLLFISGLAILTSPFLSLTNYFIILIPIYFHSIYFNNGIVPPFILTNNGSGSASIYKIVVSFLFYAIALASIFYLNQPEYSFVYVSYILLPLLLGPTLWMVYKEKIMMIKLKRYLRI